jgi:hypothetical protein
MISLKPTLSLKGICAAVRWPRCLSTDACCWTNAEFYTGCNGCPPTSMSSDMPEECLPHSDLPNSIQYAEAHHSNESVFPTANAIPTFTHPRATSGYQGEKPSPQSVCGPGSGSGLTVPLVCRVTVSDGHIFLPATVPGHTHLSQLVIFILKGAVDDCQRGELAFKALQLAGPANERVGELGIVRCWNARVASQTRPCSRLPMGATRTWRPAPILK